MNIQKQHLAQLWYENEAGERYYPTREDYEQGFNPPLTFDYQRSMFATEVHDRIFQMKRDEKGRVISAELVFGGTSTYNGQLVFKMAESGDYTFDEAVLVAAQACERCTNALHYKYRVINANTKPEDGLFDGYPEDSEEYRNSGTRCLFCDPAMQPKMAEPQPQFFGKGVQELVPLQDALNQ